MKIVHVMAMRLPSALLGVLMVWCVYDLGRKWMRDEAVGFMAAFLATFSWFTLEMISGRNSLDHNDLAFTAYMTGALWALTRYVHSGHKLSWAILIGVFTGLAILNKWLVGLLIYGGWGLYLLLLLPTVNKRKWIHITLGLLMTCFLVIPWQLYIFNAFPLESAAAYKSNWMHFPDDLGHPDTSWSHLLFLPNAYHALLVFLFLPIGIAMACLDKQLNRKLSVSFLAMIAVIFFVFSCLVACKMPAFVFPVAGLMFVLMGKGMLTSISFIYKSNWYSERARSWLLLALTLVGGFCMLKPFNMIEHSSGKNEWRNVKINTARLFRSLPDSDVEGRIVFNTKSYDNIDFMFYKNTVAYHYYFTETTLDSLQASGYKFAAFDYDVPALPEYVLKDPEIIILPVKYDQGNNR